MDSQTHQPVADQPSPNGFGRLTAQLAQYGQNLSNNVQDSVNNMTTQSWIRLVVIVGGYMLLRPYLMKFAGRGTMNQLEAEGAKSKAEEYGETTPNDLRGVKEKILRAEEKDDGESTGNEWGQRAKARQRQMLKHLLEEEENRRQEEEDDADIQEFLHD